MVVVDKYFFDSIPNPRFEIAGDNRTGTLYHWYWDNKDTTGQIEKLLVSKKFTKGSFFSTEAQIQGEFTRIEMPINHDPNEITLHIEYFDGKGHCSDQLFIKSNIKRRIDFLTVISVIGAFASVAGLVVGILAWIYQC